MANSVRQFPTLRDVIGLALAQGCELRTVRDAITGARGQATSRYLLKTNVIYPLADIDDDARLTPTVLESMERVLDLTLVPKTP